METLLRLSEVAESLGICERTLRRLVDMGRFPRPLTVGRGLRWRPESVATWIEEQTR